MAVSILARSVGRALPPSTQGSMRSGGFQSSPGQLAGRYHSQARQLLTTCRFNPRPVSWPGATRTRTWRLRTRPWFQSSPGQLAGRYAGRPWVLRYSSQFQSSPGQLAGRYLICLLDPVDLVTFQSSPGQLAGRYLRFIFHNPRVLLFQSSPGQLAGRYGHDFISSDYSAIVSILARSVGRALRECHCYRL